jgi:hypothetical protein
VKRGLQAKGKRNEARWIGFRPVAGLDLGKIRQRRANTLYFEAIELEHLKHFRDTLKTGITTFIEYGATKTEISRLEKNR